MADFELAQAMAALKKQGATGVLEVRADDRRTLIHWSGGMIAFAEENAVSETLGRLLVRQRRMTSDQYTEAIDKMTHRLSAQENVRFGQVIQELGFLDAAQVRAALVDQVRWRVVRALLWENPSWAFLQGEKDPGEEPRSAIPFDVEPLILLLARWVEPEKVDEFLAPYMDDAPSVASRDYVSARLGLDGDAAAFVATLDGKRSIAAILDETPTTEETGARAVLTALLLTEACALETLTPIAPPVTTEATEPLAAPRPAMVARIATTKIRAVRPSASPQASASESKGDAQPRTLFTQGVARPDSRDARLNAEQSFQSGRSHLRRGDIPSALQHFLLAAELWDGSFEYRLYAQWAEWLSGEETDPKAAEILETARKTILQDPNLGFPRYVMGRLALRRGDRASAERLLRFAAKLDPTLSGAVRLAQEKVNVSPGSATGASVVVSPVVVVSEPPPPATTRGPEQELLAMASQTLSLEPAAPSEVLSVPSSALFSLPSAEVPPPLPGVPPTPDTPASPEAPPESEALDVPSSALISVPPPPATSAKPPPLPSEPAPAAKPSPAVVAASSPGSRRPIAVAFVGALVCAAAAAIALRGRTPDASITTSTATAPSATSSTASADPTPAASRPAPAESVTLPPPDAAAPAKDAAAPAKEAGSASDAAAPDAASSNGGTVAGAGELVIEEAGGHRVWVDGKLVGESPLKIQTTCGRHEVQVGSAGTPHTVNIPCGASAP